jgi:spermidine synthase
MMRRLVGALAGAVLLLNGQAAWADHLIHQERSLYRNIFVFEDRGQRCLAFRKRRDFGRESCMKLSDPDFLVFDYTRMMMAALFVDPEPKRILIIGLGGATLPTALQEMLPNTQIDVVEIDEAVQRAARDYFSYRPGPNEKVYIDDGRVYVRRYARQHGPAYDMVMLDAYADDYIPEHMLTREFLTEVKSIMTPNGVIVANTWPGYGLYDHESTTYASVFGTFYNMKTGNRVIVGRVGGLPPAATLRANAQAWSARLRARGADTGWLLRLMETRPDWRADARILTDQYSPSNLLNAMGR